SSPHDPDSGAFRILDRELEEGYRLSAPGLDLLSRRARRPERRDGHRGRDFARAQDDARHHDLLPLRRIAAQPREVDLGPVLAGPFEPVRHVPPDRGSRLAGNIPESLDHTLEVRVRLGGLGHGKRASASRCKVGSDLNVWMNRSDAGGFASAWRVSVGGDRPQFSPGPRRPTGGRKVLITGPTE